MYGMMRCTCSIIMHRHQGHCLTRHAVGCKWGGASNDSRNGGREGLSRAAVSCRRLGETGEGRGCRELAMFSRKLRNLREGMGCREMPKISKKRGKGGAVASSGRELL